MDRRHFDDIARTFARVTSRRGVFRSLVATSAGGAAALAVGSASAARRIKPACCPDGFPALCGLTCTDLSSDEGNCGSCGNLCASGATCTSGICQCPSGQTVCSGTCVSTTTDSNNCGFCGVQCPHTCVNGECFDLCADPANCDDHVDCTLDTCNSASQTCQHVLNDSFCTDNDGNDCTQAVCDASSNVNGGCVIVPTAPGSACFQSGGVVCDGSGNCVACIDNTQCDSLHHCDLDQCVPN